MNVRVIWATNNPESINRGYWDDAFLEDIFDRTMWRPRSAINFLHGDTFPENDIAEGAVVVIPARHNVNQIAWLNGNLAKFAWVLLILTGDEESAFPWKEVVHSRLKVWVMSPKPALHSKADGLMGSGYTPDTHDTLRGFRDEGMSRPLDWFFAGQVTHVRRFECMARLRTMPGGELVETEGFTLGLPREEYLRKLVSAKVAPCPSGPETVDTFRLWEALEAGCVPIADGLTPKELQYDFWGFVVPGAPFPVLHDWAQLPATMEHELKQWPANANKVFAWWQQYKRAMVYRLEEQVRQLSDTQRDDLLVDDHVTVIVPTSPIPAHPSTGVIEQTIQSIRDRLPHAEIIIVCDGIRPEQELMRKPYDEYIRRLLWLCNFEWSNVLPVLMPKWGHQANATRLAMKFVETPAVLFVEHDTPICGDIPWELLTHMVESGMANVIRLHHEASILPPHRHLMLELEPKAPEAPVVRTVQWSQRPHLASTHFYRHILDTYFTGESRTMIEDVMHGVVQADWSDRGEPGWWDWRIWMYAPPGDMKRSTHLDARGDEPKFDMVFRYPGAPPPGAPRP